MIAFSKVSVLSWVIKNNGLLKNLSPFNLKKSYFPNLCGVCYVAWFKEKDLFLYLFDLHEKNPSYSRNSCWQIYSFTRRANSADHSVFSALTIQSMAHSVAVQYVDGRDSADKSRNMYGYINEDVIFFLCLRVCSRQSDCINYCIQCRLRGNKTWQNTKDLIMITSLAVCVQLLFEMIPFFFKYIMCCPTHRTNMSDRLHS